MLPDFTDLVTQLQDAVTMRLRLRVRSGDPVISMIGHMTQYEGDRQTYETVQGDERQTDYQRVEGLISISRPELRELTLEDILKKVDAAAEEMTGQIARSMFATIGQAAETAGNLINNEGKPFMFDTFLAGIERVDIDFDEATGRPHMPRLVMHPDLWAKVKDKLPEWETNPESRRRFAQLIEKKRNEWNDRESRRKLVD
jgi:hypothetical protein